MNYEKNGRGTQVSSHQEHSSMLPLLLKARREGNLTIQRIETRDLFDQAGLYQIRPPRRFTDVFTFRDENKHINQVITRTHFQTATAHRVTYEVRGQSLEQVKTTVEDDKRITFYEKLGLGIYALSIIPGLIISLFQNHLLEGSLSIISTTAALLVNLRHNIPTIFRLRKAAKIASNHLSYIPSSSATTSLQVR